MPARVTDCVPGWGMCVSVKHNVIVVSNYRDDKLYQYSLDDGSLVRSVGGHGSRKGRFNLDAGA